MTNSRLGGIGAIFTLATLIAAPLQSAQAAGGAGIKALAKQIHKDLDRVVYLTDTISKKVAAQDSAVCAGGKELERLMVTLRRVNTSYDSLIHTASLVAPSLEGRVREEAASAFQALKYLTDADLKAECALAATGTSGKAMAHMSVTLDLAKRDLSVQRGRSIQLERDAAAQASYAAQP